MSTTERIDKQHRYPWPAIETAVQMYYQQNMTYRLVSEKLALHGVEVSHKTVFEWVQKFSNEVDQKTRRRIPSYEIEESYVKCNGKWKYMYRAFDRQGATVSVFMRDKRNLATAKSFFKKTVENQDVLA